MQMLVISFFLRKLVHKRNIFLLVILYHGNLWSKLLLPHFVITSRFLNFMMQVGNAYGCGMLSIKVPQHDCINEYLNNSSSYTKLLTTYRIWYACFIDTGKTTFNLHMQRTCRKKDSGSAIPSYKFCNPKLVAIAHMTE